MYRTFLVRESVCERCGEEGIVVCTSCYDCWEHDKGHSQDDLECLHKTHTVTECGTKYSLVLSSHFSVVTDTSQELDDIADLKEMTQNSELRKKNCTFFFYVIFLCCVMILFLLNSTAQIPMR